MFLVFFLTFMGPLWKFFFQVFSLVAHFVILCPSQVARALACWLKDSKKKAKKNSKNGPSPSSNPAQILKTKLKNRHPRGRKKVQKGAQPVIYPSSIQARHLSILATFQNLKNLQKLEVFCPVIYFLASPSSIFWPARHLSVIYPSSFFWPPSSIFWGPSSIRHLSVIYFFGPRHLFFVARHLFFCGPSSIRHLSVIYPSSIF